MPSSFRRFSIDRPEEFLSSRSIERRKRQKLAVDLTDLPVAPAYVKAVSQAGVEIVGRSKWNNTLLVRVHKEKQLRRLQELSFITRKVKVFASPDSVSQRKRTSFRKELSPWESNGEAYGSADAQISSLPEVVIDWVSCAWESLKVWPLAEVQV